MDSLRTKRTKKAFRMALESLPKGAGAYDLVYRESIQRLKEQDSNSRELAEAVLLWIIWAKRPLSAKELKYALAIEIGESTFDPDNLTDIEDMISVCAGLVIVDRYSEVVRLAHFTIQEYLERTWQDHFDTTEAILGGTCLTLLSFDDFQDGC